MTKTPIQEKLEAQRGKDIKEILIETLERFKGRQYLPMLVASELGISDATFYNWCSRLEICINRYRFPNDMAEDEITNPQA